MESLQGWNPGSLSLGSLARSLALMPVHSGAQDPGPRVATCPQRTRGRPPPPAVGGAPTAARSPALCSFPACMAPRGTAPIHGSCPTWWPCAWPPSTPATKSSSTGQCPRPWEGPGGHALSRGRGLHTAGRPGGWSGFHWSQVRLPNPLVPGPKPRM